jgi:transcriptional accessory protein Tex/SPT6
VGLPTLRDIMDELAKPGRDPREDLPKPIFRNDVLSMEDLKPGMMLTGTVRNVIDFGAFVDIGVKQDGLVHISELSDKYVKNPNDVVAVGDIVEVRVKEVDLVRKRIALSMKKEISEDAPKSAFESGSRTAKPASRRESPKKPVNENANITTNSLRESFLKAGFKVK